MSKVIKGSGFAPIATDPFGRSAVANKKPIIERERVEASSRAQEIIEEAENRAQAIVQAAEQQAEEARRLGFAKGREEGLAKYTQETAQALLRVEGMVAQLEPTFVQLIRVCVEQILGELLKAEPEHIVTIVRQALGDARQQREISVRVHPADAEILHANERRLLEVLARANTIQIREDPSVKRGGCVVVTELGVIDASLEQQLQALEAAVLAELGTAE